MPARPTLTLVRGLSLLLLLALTGCMLTTSTEGGSIEVSPAGACPWGSRTGSEPERKTYACNQYLWPTLARFEAVAEEGFEFSHWAGDAERCGDDPECDLFVTHLRTASAVFTPIQPDFEPTQAFVGRDGVLYLFSPEIGTIFRWLLADERYLPPIALGEGAEKTAYSEIQNRLYVSYADGRVETIDLTESRSPQEFVRLPSAATRLAVADPFPFVGDHSSGGSFYTFQPGGKLVDRVWGVGTWPQLSWSPSTRRMYWANGSDSLHFREVDHRTGEMIATGKPPYTSYVRYASTDPVRPSPDGSLVLTGTGNIFDGATLRYVRSLPVEIRDAAWLAEALITVRDDPDAGGRPLVERWDEDFRVVESQRFEGHAHHLLATPHGALLVTMEGGTTALHWFEPGDDADADGIVDDQDRFPLDPAASLDSDGDGAPDAWNPGRGSGDSVEALVLDAFPFDAACQRAEQGIDGLCDIASTVSAESPHEIVGNGAGLIYLLSKGSRRIDRWSSTQGTYLDPLFTGRPAETLAYSAETKRLFYGDPDGGIHWIDVANPEQQGPFAAVQHGPSALTAFNGYLFAAAPNYRADEHHVFGADGTLVWRSVQPDASAQFTWSAAQGRLYHLRDSSSGWYNIYWNSIDAVSGELIEARQVRTRSGDRHRDPVRVSPDGSSLMTGSGGVYRTTDFKEIARVGLGHTDAAWTTTGVLTIADDGSGSTTLEQRSPEGILHHRDSLAGSPLRLVPTGSGYVVVTVDDGAYAFHPYEPSDGSDGDGVPNAVDDFPTDVAASRDTDGDGHPDAWNPGRDASHSTTSLVLDAFPLDLACQLPGQERQGACDPLHAIPEYVPDDLVVGRDGTVYLLSAENDRVYRWSLASGYHLDPIPIAPDATAVTYSEALGRLLVGHEDTLIRSVDPAAYGAAQIFATHWLPMHELRPVGSLIYAASRHGDWHLLFDASGAETDSIDLSRPSEVAWDSEARRMFYLPIRSDEVVRWVEIDFGTGSFGAEGSTEREHERVLRPPLLLPPADGSFLFTGPGYAFDLESGQTIGAIPHGLVDGLLLGDGLLSLRATEEGNARIEQWSDSFLLTWSRELPGEPLRLLRWDDRVFVVTLVDGIPAFTEAVVGDDSDGDGVANGDDDFPDDPAASVDSDLDGAPDDWNPGAGPADSSTGLVRDAFPLDTACQTPAHGSGGQCDIGGSLPPYDPDDVEIDRHGTVHLLSSSDRRIYRWSAATGDHLDPLVTREPASGMEISPVDDGVFLEHARGAVTRLDPEVRRSETTIAQVYPTTSGIEMIGGYLLVADVNGSRRTYRLIDAEGVEHSTANYSVESTDYEWSPADGRMYIVRGGYTGPYLYHAEIDAAAGTIAGFGKSARADTHVTGPVRAAPSGRYAVDGSGAVYDAEELRWRGYLGSAFHDAAWHGDEIVTISAESADAATRIDQWGVDGDHLAFDHVPGEPVRILPWDGGFIVVTRAFGRAEFHTWHAVGDVDGDGVENAADAFRTDPAASVDSDGDGAPDAWNPGSHQGESTTGLQLDAFPSDPSCWAPEHEFGGQCDVARGLPEYTPTDVLVDASGVIHLLGRDHEKIFRWSIVDDYHQSPIEIGSGALQLAYDESEDALYVGYDEGTVTRIDSTAEIFFAAVPRLVTALETADGAVLAVDGDRYLYTFDQLGNALDTDYSESTATEYVWSAVDQRMYFIPFGSRKVIRRFSLDPSTGELGAHEDSLEMKLLRAPVRVSQDAPVLVDGSGTLHDRESLAPIDRLPHSILDAAWVGDDLITLRADGARTRVEQWQGAAGPFNSQHFDGTPLRVVVWRDAIIVLTLLDGKPAFHRYVRSDDPDGDSVASPQDDFPHDPAASLDSDGDGAPDAWNPGADESDSTTGLEIDAFPHDSACQLESQGVGGVCDIAAGIPAAYGVDAAALGDDGIVYLLSSYYDRIFRWSLRDGAYLNPIPVDSGSKLLAYSSEHEALYVGYRSGSITSIPLAGALREAKFTQLGWEPALLASLGPWVLTSEPAHSGQWLSTFDSEGALVSTEFSSARPSQASWSPVSGRLYMVAAGGYGRIYAVEVDPSTGEFGETFRSAHDYRNDLAGPVLSSADDTMLVLGSGHLVDAHTLEVVGTFGTPFSKASFFEGGLVTLRYLANATYIEEWNEEYELRNTAVVPGQPVASFPWQDGLLIVSRDSGRPTLTVYSSTDDRDADGVATEVDAFPDDPSASLDSDGDGAPDAWNPGSGAESSTTGLVLDAFPFDSACQLPEHGSDGICDIARSLPAYEVNEQLLGPDGVLYLMSQDGDRIYRWSLHEEAHLNPIVVGPGAIQMAFSESHGRLYVGYDDGRITYLDPASPGVELLLGTIPRSVHDIVAVGDSLFVVTKNGPISTLSMSGDEVDRDPVGYSYSDVNLWSSLNRRLYSSGAYRDGDDLYALEIDSTTGEFGEVGRSPYSNVFQTADPAALSPGDEALLLRNGQIHDAVTLQVIGSIGSNNVAAAWTDAGIVSLRSQWGDSTLLERRGSGLELWEYALYPGVPSAVYGWGERFLVVTWAGGGPSFHWHTPVEDSDGDGTDDEADAFPTDPAASIDSDEDGYPDRWNFGAGPHDSTRGLVLDLFPDDFACQLGSHGIGARCDFAYIVPEQRGEAFCDDDLVDGVEPPSEGFDTIPFTRDLIPLCAGWAITANTREPAVTVRRLGTGRIGAVFPLPREPLHLALDEATATVYVNLLFPPALVRLDLITGGYEEFEIPSEEPVYEVFAGDDGDAYVLVGDGDPSGDGGILYRLPAGRDALVGGWLVNGRLIRFNRARGEVVVTGNRSAGSIARHALDASGELVLLQQAPANSQASDMAISRDGGSIFVGSRSRYAYPDGDRRAAHIDASDLRNFLGEYPVGDWVVAVATDSTGTRLAAVDHDGVIFTFDAATGEEIWPARFTSRYTRGVAYSRGDRMQITWGSSYRSAVTDVHWVVPSEH